MSDQNNVMWHMWDDACDLDEMDGLISQIVRSQIGASDLKKIRFSHIATDRLFLDLEHRVVSIPLNTKTTFVKV
jgi:hypothetical protein